MRKGEVQTWLVMVAIGVLVLLVLLVTIQGGLKSAYQGALKAAIG